MRHRLAGKHLGRTPSHRRVLLRNLAASLIEHEAVRTTEAKAKQAQRFIEKLISTARQGTLHARRRVISLLQDRHMTDEEGELTDQTVVGKLFDQIAPRYADRPGGYTRIIHLSDRRIGDSGNCVLLQLVEQEPARPESAPRTGSRRKRRASKRHEAAAGVVEPSEPQEQAEREDTGAGETRSTQEDQDDQPRETEQPEPAQSEEGEQDQPNE